MSEIEYDSINGAVIVNESDFSDDEVVAAINEQWPEWRGITKGLTSWASAVGGYQPGGRKGSVFDRDRWVTPENIFDKFKMAADAARTDDVVAGVVETTEQLAFRKVAFSCTNHDEESVWNQVADSLNLTQRLREVWREDFTISQCYVAVQWGRKSFKVKSRPGPKTSRKSRKVFQNLRVPVAISILDPLKIIPVGNFMFGNEQLAYIADRDEAAAFETTLADKDSSDLIVSSLIKSRYEPSKAERKLISASTGSNSMNLFLLNPDTVFRITSTRPAYRRFAEVRLESVFELLDLKQQLRQMDRASLLGSINAIILVKKGSDNLPAKPAEMEPLRAQFAGSPQRPVIISDHRLEVEIITPKTDKTLAAERHNALDSRITSRLYQLLSTGNYASGTAKDSSINLMKVVSSSMESRRDHIRDTFMDNIFDVMFQRNDELTEEPTMGFYPSRIALDFDPTVAQYLQTLRDRGDISRRTILGELGIDLDEEVARRELERELYDEYFMPPNNVPYDGDHVGPMGKAEQKSAGRSGGGNNNGGGTNTKSFEPTNTKGPKKAPTPK